ncbi:hypothetical protein EGW08_012168, partial [Elysia chlorotica]
MADPAEELLPLLGINMDQQRESDDSELSSGEEDDDSISSGVEEEEMEHDAHGEMGNHQGDGNGPEMEPNNGEALPALMLRQRRWKNKLKISLRKKSRDSDSQRPTIVNFDQSLPSSHS